MIRLPLLPYTDISLSVPICNSLTFVFTALTAWLIGEEIHSPGRTLLGISVVLVGITICVTSKVE